MSLGNTSIHQRGEIPEITKLPNNRIRVVRRFQKFTREDVDNANLGSLMGNFGDLDTTGEQITNQGYTDCRLISVDVDTRFNSQANADNAVLVKTYETLTSSFVQIVDDTIDFPEDGIKRVTREYRAVSGTLNSRTVGTAYSVGGVNLYLASYKIEDNDAFAQLTEVYINAGTISESISEAPSVFAGAKQVTRKSVGVASVPAGVLIDSVDENSGGYTTFTRTCLQNISGTTDDLTGTTQEFKDVIEVQEIGTIELTTIATETGGTMAIVKATPPRRKQVSATVTTEITTTPPNTDPTDIAYNLEDASVSVTTTKSSLQVGAGATVVARDGSTSLSATGSNQNISNSARIQIYDGYYLTGNPTQNQSVGTESYTSSTRPRLNSAGDAIVNDTSTSTETTKCQATGATSLPASYKVYGLVKRTSNHVLTALNGTKYYEVTSWTIPQ